MTSVLIERGGSGELLSCAASGHAGYAAAGSDIVCSAVTVLIRTTAQILSEAEGVQVDVRAGRRGVLNFSVRAADSRPQTAQLLAYAGDFLEAGLRSVAEEYPQNLEIQAKTV